ncbi:hypothetical protein VCR4J5_200094 [Vibrio crassostreae]|uniref:Uncharacterized protein n=1 Tax=Vibrio crassostreae TaxID=246167 RepID=A0A822N3Q4_9VIBR|nr:hypothetical protein VCR9J2_1330052 [Vibrio crassostreae]CDT32973.1 hypothetical protein VCR4J5_200094 [Vibrio crassostreae]CDT33504.1 hypothetical protein VCR15J5_560109 [Vibrio crassostreae]CDT49129.1 hypothetical protein VCR19J5_560094 [Vibrio crassostreae]CDT58080.1 hypothetical protein VCR5J5_720017 [Vibrio crassostreae]
MSPVLKQTIDLVLSFTTATTRKLNIQTLASVLQSSNDNESLPRVGFHFSGSLTK